MKGISSFQCLVGADLLIGAGYYLIVRRFDLLSRSSLRIQVVAFAIASIVGMSRLYCEAIFLKNKSLAKLCTPLPYLLNSITSVLSKLSWKLTLLNTGILGGSQLLRVLIINQYKREIIEHVIRQIDTIFPDFPGGPREVYTDLLRGTQDINAQYEGWTVLHYCVYRFSYIMQSYRKMPIGQELLNLMKYIIANGADITKTDAYGRTPIYFASIWDASQSDLNKQYCELLFANQNLLIPPNKDVQPLHTVASLSGKLVVDLIEHGAKTDAIDKYGRMPLHCAVIHHMPFDEGFYNIRALVHYEPRSLEHPDLYGNFPLYYAAIFSAWEVFRFILELSSHNVVMTVLEKIKQIKFSEDPSSELIEKLNDIFSPCSSVESAVSVQSSGLNDVGEISLIEFLEEEDDDDGGWLRQLEKDLHIYDPIYNVPPLFKVMFGGGPKKKSLEHLILKELQKKGDEKKTSYNGYDTYHDGHGWKHVINEQKYKEKFSKTGQRGFAFSTKDSKPAKFLPDFGKDYQNHVRLCVERWVDDGADSDNLYVRFSGNIGADNGELTSIVEIYFTASGGAHIRPKYLDRK